MPATPAPKRSHPQGIASIIILIGMALFMTGELKDSVTLVRSGIYCWLFALLVFFVGLMIQRAVQRRRAALPPDVAPRA